ncbi:alanine--tRNA ligase [Caloranaerobacter azorensis]|uniref:Alanine--tRNA ligase n=1 Tax=Caloranaerobacter azorensis TaxID=116090 RepID=A0A6P1YC59_9FIRM|nr:alanine--tRNA ligase [Caloranaerobacter azorensis]QIB26492.1 alanine--tRNA ligase [Caloranaerobacter azorensis]
MKKLSLHEVRSEFLNFFKEKEHLIVPSYSLIPKNDRSLLLINAGMAPLKPYFVGKEEPPRKRMATCQKCVRTGDIENVGKTDRHATFFEMLGNFSFGDYFKEEAIKWAWEFITKRLQIPEDKLWVSVYYEDDEAFEIWNKVIGIDSNRIIRLGKEDNFWELEIGPCGPCSEIYVDRGEKYGCGKDDCKPGCDCDRYVEVWNLVFSQFDKDENGNYKDLPNPNIDTGMGLERITAVLQGASNIFEIEPIKSILNKVEEISGVVYGKDSKKDTSIRVITDHIRAITFLVGDGVLPSNEGRGYVLRRLIRRAARHGKLLGINEKFLSRLSNIVIENWKEVYPELEERQVQIKSVIDIEEDKFNETIDQGINILREYIEKIKSRGETKLDGESAFKLYDTYGFPLDLTREILEEEGLTVDELGFNREMDKQRERARKARAEKDSQAWDIDIEGFDINKGKTIFRGYNNIRLETEILNIIKDNKVVKKLEKGQEGILVLKETPFYPESGGQVGDKGKLLNSNFECEVFDTKKGSKGVILHKVIVKNGEVSEGDKVEAIVDEKKRLDAARNHSATHLLHRALKDIVGEHVNQAGSLVEPNRLRFDFTHFEGLNKDTLEKIEKLVNEKILQSLNVETFEVSLDEAIKMGAVALFGEKYGEKVRVVKMGDYSLELCGGTHISNTSQIGMFKIVSESGVASGIRRIEAITGIKVFEYLNNMEKKINSLAELLKTNKKEILDKTKALIDQNKLLEKEIDNLKSKIASSKVDDIVSEKVEIDGLNLIVKRIDDMGINELRQLGDRIRDKMDSVLVVLGSVKNDKISFVAMATKDLVSKGIHAGNIIREVAKETGGGGGGRPDMAQAGGKDVSKIDIALSKVVDIVKGQL